MNKIKEHLFEVPTFREKNKECVCCTASKSDTSLNSIELVPNLIDFIWDQAVGLTG